MGEASQLQRFFSFGTLPIFHAVKMRAIQRLQQVWEQTQAQFDNPQLPKRRDCFGAVDTLCRLGKFAFQKELLGPFKLNGQRDLRDLGAHHGSLFFG